MTIYDEILKAIKEEVDKCSDSPSHLVNQITDGADEWKVWTTSYKEDWGNPIEGYDAPEPWYTEEEWEKRKQREEDWEEVLREEHERWEKEMMDEGREFYPPPVHNPDDVKKFIQGVKDYNGEIDNIDGIIVDIPTVISPIVDEDWADIDYPPQMIETVKKAHEATNIGSRNNPFNKAQTYVLNTSSETRDWANFDTDEFVKTVKKPNSSIKKVHNNLGHIIDKYG